MPKIYWAGDSTVKSNDIKTYPQTGIGQVFSLYVKKGIQIENHAENGRSTKSFIDESRLPAIYDSITVGDFFFIQFGHNDEKIMDPSRYTEPFSEYMENLGKFIAVARNKNAYPVLITPLERRCFTDGRLGIGEHTDYVAAMKQTAEKLQVPLIDLYSMSRMELKKAGKEKSKYWYMNLEPGEFSKHPEGQEDNTHLRYEGAVLFAGCIARGLQALGGVYGDLLVEGMEE